MCEISKHRKARGRFSPNERRRFREETTSRNPFVRIGLLVFRRRFSEFEVTDDIFELNGDDARWTRALWEDFIDLSKKIKTRSYFTFFK